MINTLDWFTDLADRRLEIALISKRILMFQLFRIMCFAKALLSGNGLSRDIL